MRYFLRKYKERQHELKPIQLSFDSDNDDSSAPTTATVSPMDQLESIPEHQNEAVYHHHNSQQATTPQIHVHQQIVTRSRFRQIQSPIATTNDNPYLCGATVQRNDTPAVVSNRQSSIRRFTNKHSILLQSNKQRNDTESSDDDHHNNKNNNNNGSTPVAMKNKSKVQQTPKNGYSSSDDSESDDLVQSKANKAHKAHSQTPPHKRFRKLRLVDTPLTPKTLIKTAKLPVLNSPQCIRQLVKVSQTSPPVDDHNRMLSDDDDFQIRMPPSHQRQMSRGVHDSISQGIGRPQQQQQQQHAQANINPFTPNHQSNSFVLDDDVSIQWPITTTTATKTASDDNQHQQRCSAKRSRIDQIVSTMGQTSESDDLNTSMLNDIDVVPKTKRLALRQCLVSRYHEEFHEICRLGSGEFGDVFKCINRLDGCTYAIKRSKKPIVGSALEVSAWKEVCAHAVLVKHNHIVQYYSAWAETDRMLIQNEYCNGGSLAEHIDKNRTTGSLMNEFDLKLLLLHTAKGLAYMHSLNLVHLDIKPGNIFICRYPVARTSVIINEESGIESEIETNEQRNTTGHQQEFTEMITYKLGDLGHVTSTRDPRVEEGDCRYLPNEILQEDYEHLPKADVFALALTVFVAGTNEDLPKNGDEWHWIRQGNLRDMSSCSDRFKKLLQQMINSNALLRPSALTLAHHPCICPYASKNKSQLLKELNQEKFKNELLQRKVQKYEQQIASPVKKQQASSKLPRSMSLNLIK